MYAIKPYRRLHAVEYARKWALARNPLFTDFADFGGDCTNFVSQSIFAGSCVMNGTETFGWYYRAPGDYAPAWTGVPYLYNFLTSNMEDGPIGMEIPVEEAEPGDVIQLGRNDGTYYHTVIVTGMRDGVPLICAHNNDALDRPLNTYTYDRARCIHITGVRITLPAWDCCYPGMLSGTSIFPAGTESLSCYPPDMAAGAGVAAEAAPESAVQPPQTSAEPESIPDAEAPLPADLLPPDFVLPQPAEPEDTGGEAYPGS